MTADDGMASYQHKDDGGGGGEGGQTRHRREREEEKRVKKRERGREEEKESRKKKKRKKDKKKTKKAERKEQRTSRNGGKRKRRDDDDASEEDGDSDAGDRDKRKKHRKKRRRASSSASSSTDSDSSSPPSSRRRKRSRDDGSSSGKRHKRAEVSAADAADALAFKIAVQGLKKAPSHASDAGGSTDATGGNNTLLELLHQTPAAVAAALGLPQGLIRTSEASNSMTDSYSKKLFGHGGDNNPARAARLRRERTAQRAVERAREMLANRGGGGGDVG